MMEAPKCDRCDVVMAEGFIPFQGHTLLRPPSWLEGAPEKSKWFSHLKTSGKKRYAVRAYRCPICGKLELFAIGDAWPWG